MMMSSNGSIFRVTGPLWGESTGHQWIPLTKASDTELWCFLWSPPWISCWINNREAGDLRCHRTHYDVIVMRSHCSISNFLFPIETENFSHTCTQYLNDILGWKTEKQSLLGCFIYCLSSHVPVVLRSLHWNTSCIEISSAVTYCVSTELILGLHPANERWRYFVMTSLIGWHKPRISPVFIKFVQDSVVSYTQLCETSAGCPRSTDPSLGMRAFWRHHKGPMTWLSIDLIKWPIYPKHWIKIYGNINTFDKESITPRCHRYPPVQLCFIYLYIDRTGILVDGIYYFAL